MDLDDRILKTIGRITVSFAYFENEIVFFISHLFHNLDLGSAITAPLSFKNRIDVLDALFRLYVEDETSRNRLKELLGRAAEAEERRNSLIHSIWLNDHVSGDVTRIKDKVKRGRGLEHQFESVSLDDLNAIADSIEVAGRNLRDFASSKNWTAS